MKKNFLKSITSNLNWILTIAWLVFGLYLWFFSGIDKPKDLNSMGDFIAGMFAPLAFFWLVRGYYQQGEELQQNTKALKLQADELKNNVIQQSILADIAKQELDQTISQVTILNKQTVINAQPYFHINSLDIRIDHYSEGEIELLILFKLKNSRSLCRSLFFTYSFEKDSAHYLFHHSTVDFFDYKQESRLDLVAKIQNFDTLIMDSNHSDLQKFYIHFCYTDSYDAFQTQSIEINFKFKELNMFNSIGFVWVSKSFT